MAQLTEHFSEKELACKCCGKTVMTPEFMTRLETLRKVLGFPLFVTSGYRCVKHNDTVGGATGSLHVRGRAVDIAASGAPAHRLIDEAIRLGFTGIGIKQHGTLAGRYVHIDDGHDTLTFWTYP